MKNGLCKQKVGMAMLISDRAGFSTKKMTGDIEGHYIMIKGSTHHEDITILQQQSYKMCEEKMDRFEKRKREVYNYTPSIDRIEWLHENH